MNKSVLQYERAASAQRDLFDTQIRIEDQLIEQKSEPNHPGSNKLVRNFAIGEQVIFTYGKARPATIVANANRTQFDPRANYKISVDGQTRIVNEAWLQKTGPTTRSLTDTFNSKL